MTRIETLRSLQKRIRSSKGADVALDNLIYDTLTPWVTPAVAPPPLHRLP